MTALARCRDGRCARMTAAGLCRPCADRLAAWLHDLPGLVARIAGDQETGCCPRHGSGALSAGTLPCAGHGPKVTGTTDRPLPGGADRLSWLGPAAGDDRTHLDPGDDRDGPMQHGAEPVASVLAEWCRLIAEERRVHRPARDLPGLLAFLVRHHDWAAAQPWADDYAVEVHGLWRTARGLAGETERSMRIGWCITLLGDGECGEPLYAQPGDDVIRCRACGADWTRELWLILGAAMEEISG